MKIIFNEKLNIYNNIIEKTIDNIKDDIINDNLTNKRIFYLYVYVNFLLLRYMYHGGAFREYIIEKNVYSVKLKTKK